MEKKKRKISIVRFIANMAFLIFIIIFFYVFIIIYRGGVPKFFGYSLLRVISNSMEPEIRQGQLIVAKDIPVKDIKKGDIITFYSRDPYLKGFLNTHRVTEVINNSDGTVEFVTKGDSNTAEDYYTALGKDVLGRYSGKIKGGEIVVHMINALQHKILYFIVMVLPILICFVHCIYSLVIMFTLAETDFEEKEQTDEEGTEKN